MIEICTPGLRCESCPMNKLRPDDQFVPKYDATTNDVTVHMVGEDIEVFRQTERFWQKARVGAEVGYTVQSGVCEVAVGSRENPIIAEAVDVGIGAAQQLRDMGVSVDNIRPALVRSIIAEYGLNDFKAEAMASVIITFAEV